MDLDTTKDEVEFLTAEQEDALLTEEAPEPPARGLEKDGAVELARSGAAAVPPEQSLSSGTVGLLSTVLRRVENIGQDIRQLSRRVFAQETPGSGAASPAGACDRA